MFGWSLLSFFFFFKQKTAYEIRISDWSSDVCSSDLLFMPIEFAGGYAAIAVLAFLSLALVQFAALPKPLSRQERSRGRPLGELIRQPALVVAVLCAMVAYGATNLILVSTPLALVACPHPFEAAAFVLPWPLGSAPCGARVCPY